MGDWASDHVVIELREQIAEADRAILETLNRRIELVGRLREYKEEQGYPFVDRAREDWLVDYLTRTNAGPLSDDGVRELVAEVLDLTKRELARQKARTL